MSIKTNELPQTVAMADSDSFVVTMAQGTKKTPLSWLRGLFAPSGFGLGQETGPAIPGGDFNNATQNGWYRCSGSEANGPDLGNVQYTGGAILFVKSSRVDEGKVQTLHLGTSGLQGLTLRRYYHHTKEIWYPWEWINPQLLPSKEYRTIERWSDSYTPVYIKRISCGKGPAAGSQIEIAHNISDMGYIVDVGGCLTIDGAQSVSLPYRKSETDQASIVVNDQQIIVTAGETDLSSYNDTQVWIKYTKTTDGAD